MSRRYEFTKLYREDPQGYCAALGRLVAAYQARAAAQSETDAVVLATYCAGRGAWTRHDSRETFSAALALTKGSYQLALVSGTESISGSTLRGKAAKYRGRYLASAQNLRERLQAAGLHVSEIRGARGARILVITAG